MPSFGVLVSFSYDNTVSFERCSGFCLPFVLEDGTGERSSVLGKNGPSGHRVGGKEWSFAELLD